MFRCTFPRAKERLFPAENDTKTSFISPKKVHFWKKSFGQQNNFRGMKNGLEKKSIPAVHTSRKLLSLSLSDGDLKPHPHSPPPESLQGTMLSLVGESTRRYRPFLLSPSSSPEDFSSPIAAAPSPPSRVARNASPSHPVKQLHTPASSVDIPSFPPSIHDSPTGSQAHTAPDSSVNALLEEQIQKLMDQIEAAKASDAESLVC